MPIPDPGFWNDLGRLIVEDESAPNHFLLPQRKAIPKRWDPVAGRNQSVTHFFHEQPLALTACTTGGTGASDTLVSSRRARRAASGCTKARHTAGQRMLDKTGNLKAVQKLLGDSSIQTTADI
jgi:integrase